MLTTVCKFLAALIALGSSLVVADDQLDQLANVAKDPKQAKVLLDKVRNRKDLTLTSILSAMKSKDQISKNYLLSLSQSVADRNPTGSVEVCQKFLADRSQDSEARFWAFTYLTTYLPAQRTPLLESMENDPCPELRFEAIEHRLTMIEKETQTKSDNIPKYEQLLKLARLPEQIQRIAKKLEELGQPVNLLQHFGFVSQWQVVGCFDNVGQAGFDVSYQPEKDYLENRLDGSLSSFKYEGKTNDLNWSPISTDKPDGKVDLNPVFKNAKGAIVYALAVVEFAGDGPAELRVGSTNAVKVWFNGKQQVNREVYHAGDQIDQYVVPVTVQPGKNTILVKVCQNEQTEQWAQEWFFQLRIADATGLAIQPKLANK